MILELLTLVFVVLKLTGVIAWSWWWVCSPALLALAIGFIIGIIVFASGIAQGLTPEEIRANYFKSLLKGKF